MATVGFSIGNEQLCIAVVQDERPTVIVSQQGHRTTPACIAFSEDEAVVGDTAKLLAVKRPREVVQGIASIVALASDPDALRARLRGRGVELVEEGGAVTGVRTFSADPDAPGAEHSLLQLVVPLLRYMRQEAEAFLGDKVDGCVLALPEEVASNDAALEIFLAAAKSCGLSVARVVRASAAALLHGPALGDGVHVVVDCGGSSCTGTVYDVCNGVLTARAVESSPVGGLDIDKAVAKHFADEFRRKNKMDISDDKKAMRRLAASSEETKKTLSQRNQGRIECEAVAEGIDMNAMLTRGRFEALLGPVLRGLKEMLAKLRASTGLDGDGAEAGYSVHLVGGTAHIAKVKSTVEEAVGREVERPQGPEEVTALGAAVQGASCSQAGVGLPDAAMWKAAAQGAAGTGADPAGVRCRVRQVAQTISVRTADGVEPLLVRGSLLPSTARWECPTDGAEDAFIDIVQGEGGSRTSVCRVALRGLAPKSKGVVLTVSMQPDGGMDVTATDGVDAKAAAKVPPAASA